LMAKRMKIPTYHMEAGNRSFDANVPEEINRKMIDHLADFNLVYTEHARRHLLAEGLPHRFIYLTGSPMPEVIASKLGKIENSTILSRLKLEQGKYFVVSIHREENVDDEDSLKNVLACLKTLRERYDFPIIFSTHPRTRNRLESLAVDLDELDIHFHDPFGYIDYNKLQVESLCVISDSGTISEESAILGFPAVTLRNSIERPEALDTGSILLTGLIPSNFIQAVEIVIQETNMPYEPEMPFEYQIMNTSHRVLKLIIGTAKLSSRWRNLSNFNRYDWDAP
jgi:UDP-N-acetyl-L-fucosamine synthase